MNPNSKITLLITTTPKSTSTSTVFAKKLKSLKVLRISPKTSSIDKAKAFKNWFHSTFNTYTSDISFDNLPFPAKSLCSLTLTKHDVYTALANLNPTKAMGGDGIPPLFLKYCAAALVDPVHYLFSQCFSQSYLPQEWCSHLIIPIPKTGDKSQISNYHPISLLCNLSKVLEKIVFDKIYKFISENSISIHQFGFLRNRSTLKQLILYTEFLCSSLDHHQQVDSIYLDIRKAFNSVPHNKLLVKLYA